MVLQFQSLLCRDSVRNFRVVCRYNGAGNSDAWGEGGGAWRGPGSAHRMSVEEIRVQQQEIFEGVVCVFVCKQCNIVIVFIVLMYMYVCAYVRT